MKLKISHFPIAMFRDRQFGIPISSFSPSAHEIHFQKEFFEGNLKNETFLSFDDLLKRDRSVSIHQKNLQLLATKIYKTKNDLGPKIKEDTFHFIQKPYNLRYDPELQRRRNRTVYFGTESISESISSESISSLAPKIWELILSDIRSANSLGIFKEKIKFWTTDKCPCRPCKTYIGNVGFI